MYDAITGMPTETILHGALELSKNRWLLALQFPDRARRACIRSEAGARDRWAKLSGKTPSIVLCYEAGYDAFWLARFLKARGIECLVVDAASIALGKIRCSICPRCSTTSRATSFADFLVV